MTGAPQDIDALPDNTIGVNRSGDRVVIAMTVQGKTAWAALTIQDARNVQQMIEVTIQKITAGPHG